MQHTLTHNNFFSKIVNISVSLLTAYVSKSSSKTIQNPNNMSSLLKNPEDTLNREIKDFVSKNPGNRMGKLDGAPYFEAP